MKYLLLSAYLFSVISIAGVGDIAGGNNKHFKAFMDQKYFFIDWPLVKYSRHTHYKIYELCVHDIDHFGTKKVFQNGQRRLMKRVYADQNCVVKNDPMCDRVNQYIDRDVEVNIYLKDREGIARTHDIKGRIYDQFLVTALMYEMPYCRDL